MENKNNNRKDYKLKRMMEDGFNIAQVISVDKDTPTEPHVKILKKELDIEGASLRELVQLLIEDTPSHMVNVRTFTDRVNEKTTFRYGMKDVDEVLSAVKDNASKGWNSLINECIDKDDTGVSGIIVDSVTEFSPYATPRDIEKENSRFLTLPTVNAMKILTEVYGNLSDMTSLDKIKFYSSITKLQCASKTQRIEFSIHPNEVGCFGSRVIIWEASELDDTDMLLIQHRITRPNAFSEMVGDKAFGLLLADSIGAYTPDTEFHIKAFGDRYVKTPAIDLEDVDVWTRTAPTEKQAGRFETEKRRYTEEEIKELLKQDEIASVLVQEAIDVEYSGSAVLYSNSGEVSVEGVKGEGDKFMMGVEDDIELPIEVTDTVKEFLWSVDEEYGELLGDVKIEWGFDTNGYLYIFQLCNISDAEYIFKLNTNRQDENIEYIEYKLYENGTSLEDFRNFVEEIEKDTTKGIKLFAHIGITSHPCDILRKHNVPAILIKDI